jgi:hypothetical protein
MPGDPKLILPGLAFAWAMNSGSDLAGNDEGEADDARDGRDVAQKNEIELVIEGRIDRVCRTHYE